MNWLDWIMLGLNTLTYALGHYHGNNRGAAVATRVLSQYPPPPDYAQAQREGTAAGAAANEASHLAGPTTRR